MFEMLTSMRDRLLWKRFAVASAAIFAAALFFAVVFIFYCIAEVRREVVPAVLAGLAESLSDEHTVRDSFVSPGVTDDKTDAILSEHGEEFNAALVSDDDNDRIGSFILLGEFGPKAVTFVPALIDALDDANPKVRRHAVYALGELGEDALSAIDLLHTMSMQEHERVRHEAAKAVEKIAGATDAIPQSDAQ